MKVLLLGTIVLSVVSRTCAADDILIADFEQTSFGDWRVEGDAFGKKPTPLALSGQPQVAGYLDDRFANSFHGGSSAKGVITVSYTHLTLPTTPYV